MSGAERGLRSPDARAFNAPLYLLSYLGKLTWRLVRESNPRLPARQAGTLATELTKQIPSGHGFRRRPIVAADFHPRSVSSTKVPCSGVACGIRTRVPGMKARCPGPARRTRLVLGALGDGSNARPAAYKAAALPAELRGRMNPLRLCPNASIPSDVVSRCT
jgi:hypothetical protein